MKIKSIIAASMVCGAFTANAMDADALYAKLNATEKGREMLHGRIVTNIVEQAIYTNDLISVSARTTEYEDNYIHVTITTNAFRKTTPREPKKPTTNERYNEIIAMREAAGWVAKPLAKQAERVRVYSVMRCVLLAKRAELWDNKIKPYLDAQGLLDLIYTAHEFRSDDPNFKAAIEMLKGIGIEEEFINSALREAEVK